MKMINDRILLDCYVYNKQIAILKLKKVLVDFKFTFLKTYSDIVFEIDIEGR